MPTRRHLLIGAGAIGSFLVARDFLGETAAAQQADGKPASRAEKSADGRFELPPLPYAFDALEPYIDAKTMELHHDRHHKAYVDKLNEAIAGHTKLEEKSVDELLMQLSLVPEDIRMTVRNNAGGHANHTMFWTLMTPGGAKHPKGSLSEAIAKQFTSFENFKKKFNEAGEKHFGSGWVFLTLNTATGEMKIASKPNQDSPLSDGERIILGNDLWEHAYYLKYNNRKAEYLQAWWNVVNWDEVERRYNAILTGTRVL